MNVCGLTGGVGMGKSTAAEIFRTHGARVVDTDEIARELVQPGTPALREIRREFGDDIIATNGELNRAGLARLVFADEAARKKLEAILHPRIHEQWLARIELWKHDDCPLAIVVIPLLFETQAEAHFQKIICVACSSVTQRQRLAARGWSPEQILQRIAAQWPVEQKIARSHFVLWTEGRQETTVEQEERILGRL